MQRIERRAALALAHGNRGRKPVQSISEEVQRQVIELASTTYAGCNYQHLRDLLAERDGIELSRTSVRRTRLPAGIASPRKQHRRQQRRRVRYAQEGMVVQIDGSRHAWLEERGPWLCLIAAIDDATGKLAAAVFRKARRCEPATFCWYSRCWSDTAGLWRSIMIGMASSSRTAKQSRPIRSRSNWQTNKTRRNVDGCEKS